MGSWHPAGFGSRKSQVRVLPARPFAARWGTAPREPHDLEKRVRLPPALLVGGVAQRGERSLVRREAAGSNPVVPVMVAVV